MQIAATGVGGTAEQNHATIAIGQERLDRIAAEIGIDRHRVGSVTLEGLDGVALGRAADVAALGIQYHGDAGMPLVNVRDQRFELVFSAAGGEIGDLRLEATDQIGRGVDDGGAEIENCPRPTGH